MPDKPTFIEHDGEFINVASVAWAERQARTEGIPVYVLYRMAGDCKFSTVTGPLAEKLIAALTAEAGSDQE